jgi:hypothetical protein
MNGRSLSDTGMQGSAAKVRILPKPVAVPADLSGESPMMGYDNA